MKNLTALLFLSLSFTLVKAQILEDLTFGVELIAGQTRAHITDDFPLPSSQSTSDDGFTEIERTYNARGVRLIVNYNFSESLALSTGFHFTERNFQVRNTDADYIGFSRYRVNYTHLPIMLRYRSNEIADYLRVIIKGGPMFGFNAREAVIGGDGAHFMNFARNRSDIDPSRGENGNGRSMNLFNKTSLSAYFGIGLEYSFSDTFSIYGGLGYQIGITNMLNPELLFNDNALTPITETTTWKSSVVGLDLGVGFSF